MPDNQVDIIIRTKAELEGVKSLKRELEGQIGVAKATGKEFSGLTQQLGMVNKALAQAIPEWGMLGRVMGTLRGGPVIALGAALGWLANQILSAKDILLAFGEVTEETGRTAADTKTRLDDYEKSMKALATAGAEAEAKLKGVKDAMTAVKAAQDKIAEDQSTRQKAEIDALVKGGQISPEQGAVRKAEIEARDIQGKAAREKSFLAGQEQIAAGEMNVKDFAAIVARQQVEQFEKASGLGGKSEKDLAQIGKQAIKDEEELQAARRQQKELRAWFDDDVQVALNPAQGLKNITVLEGLNQSIPGLEAMAGRSAKRAEDAAQLQAMREQATVAGNASRLGQITFAGQRRVFQIQRGAIDQATPEQLATVGLQAAGEVAGSAHEAANKRQEEILKFGFGRIDREQERVNRRLAESMAGLLRRYEQTNSVLDSVLKQLNRDSGLK